MILRDIITDSTGN